MKNLFKQFDDNPPLMEGWIKDHFKAAPADLLAHMAIEVAISDTRIALAVAAYREQIARFAEYLNSQDPDHYKRCGALLFALCANPIIARVKSEYSAEDVESGFSRVQYAASDDVAKMLDFYHSFHNQFVAYELCHKICEMYEGRPKPLSFDAIHNICFYLKRNNLPIDAYFMHFKVLML